MKKRIFLLSVIFAFAGFAARGQIVEMYNQGFEGTGSVYTVSSPANGTIVSDLAAGGSSSIKLTQLTTGDVELLLDTLDFTQNLALSYIALEFDHINNIYTNGGANTSIGEIWVKRVNQSTWTQANSSNYDVSGEYTTQFVGTSTFNRNSYTEWMKTTMTNQYWKHERFTFNSILSNVAAADRKVLIKFVLKSCTLPAGPGQTGWWLDNIRVRASQSSMIRPDVQMVVRPDGGAHPNSRGARIMLEAHTSLAEGICQDSVYIIYTVGSDPTPIRLPMTYVGEKVNYADNYSWSRFSAMIPFEGYDTVMRYYCVVKDNTSNHNEVTYPRAAGAMDEYWCIRGVAQPGIETPDMVGTSNNNAFPFPGDAVGFAEWVFDSAYLANNGYGPGAITDLRFTVGANSNASTRPKFNFRFMNAPTSHTVTSTQTSANKFTQGYAHVVLDSDFYLPAMTAGQELNIHLQDTFFYAGKDLIMQALYFGTQNMGASTSIKTISAPSNKMTAYAIGVDAMYNCNPYVNSSINEQQFDRQPKRPAIVMTQHANKPLIYDMGISRLTHPTYVDPLISETETLQAKLNNYGVSTINAVRVSWTIDDTIFGHTDWTGSIAGGDSATINIGTITGLPAGYHYLRTWVEDTLTVTAGNLRKRDHEPYNDTAYTEFIVCEGPLSGVRQIGGGQNADYNNIEEFLFSLSRCGIDDSLVVKLAPGEYPPFVMTPVSGLTEQHYIVYESLDPENPAIMYADETTGTSQIIDISQVANIRFRDLTFVRRGGTLTNMVGMSTTTDNCHFERCSFIDSVENPAAAMRIASMLDNSYADNMLVEGCTFEGGLAGVTLSGQSITALSTGNTVRRNVFRNQYNKAVDVENQSNVTVDHNEMYDVLTNNSYVLQLIYCYGTVNISGNRILTTNGAGAIGISDMHGTQTNHAIVANNMIVCDDAAGNHTLTSPLNVIKAEWTDVVYNSVKLTATSRTNVPAATFGGTLIENCRFLNNVLACMDNRNYAFNYMPGNQTTNTVGYNVYYTMGPTLNRRTGASYSSLALWQQAVPEDSMSISTNPVFLTGTLVDLRTFNRQLKGKGMPIAEVSVDINDTVRSATTPCPGAFEFSSLPFDFEVEAMPSPVAESCNMPENVELQVRLRNGGTSRYTPDSTMNFQMAYSINNGQVHTFTVPHIVPAEDTITVHTGQMLNLPPDGILDAVYDIKVWTICANDPNQTNDTNTFRVVSRYQITAPDDVEATTEYMTPATITVTEGVVDWSLYGANNAPTEPSIIYWYYNEDDDEPFFVGNTLVTTPLRQDTHFYVKQQREVSMVRFTQVMVKSNNTSTGLTTPLPDWMNNATQLAVQLTNIGDDTAYLGGDTLRIVSPSNSYNNKGTLKFDNNVVLAPGQAIVVQYISGTSPNAEKTIYTKTKITPPITTDMGFIYRNGTVIDAVALNNVVSAASSQSVKWSTQHVPSYVWSGTQGVSTGTGSTAGGFVRVAFNGNSSDWTVSNDNMPVNLNYVNPDWIRYSNNGCEGGAALVNVTISNKPTSDIDIEAYPLASGCGLGVEPLTVRIHNYGDSAVAALQLNYTLGGDTVSETLSSPVVSYADTTYTFAQSPNLDFDADSVVNIVVWVTMTEGDVEQSNDTARLSTVSLKTLAAPAIGDTIEAQYGETTEVTFDFPANVMPVWYDYNGNPVDTGFVYETDVLYTEGEFGISYMVKNDVEGRIGMDNTTTGKTAYPSPFQPNNRFVKQQYIYSAHELRSLGLGEGQISRIAFHLDSIYGTRDTVLYDQYYISMGMTSDSIFANVTDWRPTTIVKQIDSLVIRRSDVHNWVWFDLDNPVTWDGESHLVVQVAFANSASVTTGMQTTYTSKNNTTLHKNVNNANDIAPSVVDFVGSGGSKGKNRPNIMIEGSTYGCNGPIASVPVVLLDVPEHDATVYWTPGFDTASFVSCYNVAPQITVFNLGSEEINGYDLHYWIDGDTVGGVTHRTDVLTAGETISVPLFSMLMHPGRHTLRAAIVAENDTILSNDTIEGMVTVRFCGNTYSITADSTGDFPSFSAAVDTLNIVGTTGSLTFAVYPGVYEEQVSLNAAPGLGGNTSISFVGQGGSADSVRIVGNTSVADNYVFSVDGVPNVIISGIRMESRPQVASVKAANVLVINNSDNVVVSNNRFRVKGSIMDANASCLVLGDSVSNISINNNIFDSGYYSIKTTGSDYVDVSISNNTFSEFLNKGIDASNVTSLSIFNNDMRAGAATDAKGLIGINLSYIDSTLSIQNNTIYLVDDHTGAKRGIHLEHVTGTDMNPAVIINNMIGLHGTGAAGLTPKNPSGIYIDNACSNINIYYNSVRVYAGATNNDTRAFFSGATNTNLQVKSNIFANFSNAYAYYIGSANSILMSDYNGYYSAGTKFAYWGADRVSLSALQTANSMDENSIQDMPYFTANDDLHLLMTNFCGHAQYDPDIMTDIDGNPRPPIGGTTIGAHELERHTRNMTVVQILQPKVPLNLNNPSNIEGDSILVVASFYNNGSSIENNVSWYAYVDNYQSQMSSVTKSLGSFNPAQMKTDSVWIPTILGVIDTQVVRVVVVSDGDEDLSDNELTANAYLAPAYNIEAVKIQSASTGCELTNAVLSITVKNIGFKPIPQGDNMQISYVAQGYHPSFIANNPDSNKLNIATMPTSPVTETVTFETPLPKNQTRVFTFTTPANFYPTDTSLNIKVRIMGWLHHQYDILCDNDTTGASTSASPVIDAYYTPRPPVGHDTLFYYGTWGEVRAEQENSRPIRWYRDSTATPFYTTSGANAYANSCWWRTTPQYFSDSTYYLMCYSDKNCPSHFSPVHVGVISPRVANDMAVEDVLAPLGGHVYMENDTVRIRIANYGTVSQSNIPVTYAVRKGNNTNPFQTVTETVTATIAPNQTYVYTFDSLIVFANSNTATTAGGTYQVRAWTDLANDQSRRNDTIRNKQILRPASNNDTQLDHVFTAKPESTYPSRTNTASDSIDIIRFSFNEIDVDLPALGRSYSNFGVFNNPEIPVLHVTQGMSDSVFMSITNPLDNNAIERGRIAIYIDFNRNGSFNDPGECVVPDTNLWYNRLYRGKINIANDASYGYTKMRVSACRFDKVPTTTLTGQDGHMLDFLLFVDQHAPAKDLAITQIAEPRDYLIRDNAPKTISFRIANRGASPINSADIHFSFIPDNANESVVTDVVNWSGNLQPGTSALVELPQHTFPLGTTVVKIWHSLEGDAVASNDTLTYEYHRFHTVILTLDDDFDSDPSLWYAPSGNNGYNRNYWQRGTPTKQNINQPYSAPNVWVTGLTGNVQSGLRGNVSYLYSPIINTAQIHPDTIAFRMMKRLTGGSKCYIEYRNYVNEWVNMASDTTDPPTWYNNTDDKCFDGNSNGYTYYYFPSSLVSGNFQELFQFRIVYRTPQGSNASASYGEGCAIDDFHIGRAKKNTDVGVIAITKPTAPKYGQTICPEVVVKNFGTDTVRRLQLGYIHYGTYLAKEDIFDSLSIPPDGVDTFQFLSPFVITSAFPDTFEIKAFTINTADIFKDNDTNVRQYVLPPLDHDIAADRFVTPLDRVIAGDSIIVTMRVFNFGSNPIHRASFSYTVSGRPQVVEEISFDSALGRPLAAEEYFNYTFHQKFRAAMGIMQVTGFVKCDTNEYIYNDTISKRFTGISSIMDLAAAAIVVDTVSSYTDVRLSLVVDNRGARGANDFEVGFWVDDDTAHIYREQYHTHNPLPALSRGYHLFETTLPPRATPYDRITAFVSIDDDNDLTNDTTSDFIPQSVDIEAVGIIVEENSAADCRTFIQLRNIGNISLVGSTMHITGSVNGNDIDFDFVRRLDPMVVSTIQLERNTPKSPTRQYSGSFSIAVSGDNNPDNNQTSVLRVVNYVEGMPTVNDADQLILEQNYPNPFSHQTTVPFSLPQAADVRFFVMDATGHIVNSFSAFYPAGPNSLVLDMAAYPAGVYYYGIEAFGQRQMRKMILR